MKHIVQVNMLGDYILTEWFINSIQSLTGDQDGARSWFERDGILKHYEETYGVRVVFDVFGWVESVEFPNEGEAIEFMLRWS